MKIFQLTFSLSSGGGERLVVNLSNQLSKKCEVYIIVIHSLERENGFYKDLVSKNINLISLNHKKGINIASFFQIINLIRKHKPDVVHSHLNSLVYSFLPSLLFNKTKFFHTIHSIAAKDLGFRWQKTINKYFFQRLIIPVTISKLCAKSFYDFYNIKALNVIENAVPKALKTAKYKDVQKEIHHFKKSQSTTVFINIARLGLEKNHDLMISTFNELIHDGEDVILIILGRCDDDEYLTRLKSLSSEGIYFLGEKKNPEDYLMNADCFVLSSKWEGLPMTILEAMSFGKPIVSTPVGGIPDVINQLFLGVLSEDLTTKSFKNAIFQFLTNSHRFNKNLILQHYTDNYSIKKASELHLNLYKI